MIEGYSVLSHPRASGVMTRVGETRPASKLQAQGSLSGNIHYKTQTTSSQSFPSKPHRQRKFGIPDQDRAASRCAIRGASLPTGTCKGSASLSSSERRPPLAGRSSVCNLESQNFNVALLVFRCIELCNRHVRATPDILEKNHVNIERLY